MKNTTNIFVLCMILLMENDNIQAQFVANKHCGTGYYDSITRIAHPELPSIHQFEAWLEEKIITQRNNPHKKAIQYSIPIIVHIVHNAQTLGSGVNINDEQIYSQINVLNKDFRKQNAGIMSLSSPPYNITNWSMLAADCEIDFCLAEKDTNNTILSSPGIHRINRNDLNFSNGPYTMEYIENTIKPATIWNPNKYLNIWVMALSGGMLGYAIAPSTTILPGLNIGTSNVQNDGVVIDYRYFGTTSNVMPPFNKGRTTTHELGHWLGLRHIWGEDGGNCSTDYSDDTPSQYSPNFGVPSFPHVSCNNGPNGDMFVNFMDYSDDITMLMFTQKQKERMHTIIENIPMRSSIVNQSNNCSAITSLYENKGASLDFNLFPNPTNGVINIMNYDGRQVKNLKIYNSHGSLLIDKIYNGTESAITIDLTSYVSGIYLIQIFSQDNGSFLEKIILN